MNDPYSYLTTWSLLINYSIFIWAVILGSVPRWLFLFAACFLTSTSIIGTFFITVPTAKHISEKNNISIQKVFLEDFLLHSGPLVLFLALFGIISKNIINNKPNNLYGPFNLKLVIHGYYKIILMIIIVIFSYLGYTNFTHIYFYDYFPTLVVLTACIFMSSYQIYSNLLN